MYTVHEDDVENVGEWLEKNHVPVYIEKDAEITIIGRLMFTRNAFLPGFTKLPYPPGMSEAYRDKIRRWLDFNVYFKGMHEGMPPDDEVTVRTMPFIWPVFHRPKLKEV